jgi:methylmalonyl-CoA/ethylmalonyl-CoA epimerase
MIDRYREKSGDEARARRLTRAEWRLREILGRAFMQHLETHVLAEGEFDRTLERIATRDTDPYRAAAGLLARATGAAAGEASVEWSIDHVGLATADADPLVDLFKRLFDLPTGEPEDVGLHRVRFVGTGHTTIELVEPLTDTSPVAKFLAQRGQGLHHVCFRVPDIDAAMAALRARGVKFIDAAPRTGAHQSRIAFIHPSSAAGVLVELKEPAAGRTPEGR